MFKTMAEIKAANKAAGRFFFSPDTMRFFESRIEAGPFNNRFVTSEKPPHEPRRFTVRTANDDGTISPAEEHFTTRAAAINAAQGS